MMMALEIAIGIWLGGLLLIGTIWGSVAVAERIKQATRYGYPWWTKLVPVTFNQ